MTDEERSREASAVMSTTRAACRRSGLPRGGARAVRCGAVQCYNARAMRCVLRRGGERRMVAMQRCSDVTMKLSTALSQAELMRRCGIGQAHARALPVHYRPVL